MTIDELRFSVTVIAALGCGLIAGVFFAFSAFVMDALARLTSAQGIAAMQSINVKVVKSPFPFLAVLFGTAAACVLLVVTWNHVRTVAALSGAALLTLALTR